MKDQMKKVAKTEVKGHEARMHGAKKMAMGGKMSYAKGGGVEHKGKTKGKMVKMAMGGKTKTACK